MIRIKLLLGILIIIPSSTFCQNQVNGQVLDSISKGIPFANISIANAATDSIIGYSYADKNGYFSIKNISTGIYLLTISALSYNTIESTVNIDEDDTLPLKFILEKKLVELNEVIVEADNPILVKKDTVVIDADSYTKEGDRVVEDLLRNIPGIEIEDDGKIKIGGREIEKVMVENDDFFNKGYGILTQSMPNSPVDKVEIIYNYSENDLLKGVRNSDKIALNLKLKEGAKRSWFGNLEAAHETTDSFYEFRSNLLNFGKKNKYFLLSDLNNIGSDSFERVQEVLKNSNENSSGDLLLNEVSAETPLGFETGLTNFRKERTNINDSELISLNTILNPTENVKVKVLSFLNFDEIELDKGIYQDLDGVNPPITNSEVWELTKNSVLAIGQVRLDWRPSKSARVVSTNNYRFLNQEDRNRIEFNENPALEGLDTDREYFYNETAYTKKLNEKSVLQLSGSYLFDKIPQRYSLDRFFYSDLFPESDTADRVIQSSRNVVNILDGKLNFYHKDIFGGLIEFSIGYKRIMDEFESSLGLVDLEGNIDLPTGFQNISEYVINDWYFLAGYSFDFESFGIRANLGIRQFHNSLVTDSFRLEETPLFFNPKIEMSWQPNNENTLTGSFSYTRRNSNHLNLVPNFLLTGIRTFEAGSGILATVDASSYELNYRLGNWGDRFFLNSYLKYARNHDYLSSNSMVTENYSVNRQLLLNDRDSYIFFLNGNRYLKKIQNNVKLKTGYIRSNYENLVNGSGVRTINAETVNLGLELKSGFKGMFNYQFGTEWKFNRTSGSFSNSFTDNLSFVDLNLILSKKLLLDATMEIYSFGNLGTSGANFNFLDFELSYKVNNRLSFSFQGNNVTNTKTLRYSFNTDIGNTTNQQRLLPRLLMVGANLKF